MDGHLRTVPKKRTANFREDETKLLIQLWGNPLIQNKLFLTHRKAPVMRILAANMQQRGFYRTPDEIKTRIRNLKCLYHRIKRTMACGTGLGTVDPDWPHFKAMDAILSKQGLRKDPIHENLLEGPKCEDIKQEIEIDFNDDWTTNDSMGSDYDEKLSNHTSPPPLQPAPTSTHKLEHQSTLTCPPQNKLPHSISSFQIPTQALAAAHQNNVNGIRAGPGSIPVPLLILNSMQPQQLQDKKPGDSTGYLERNNDVSLAIKSLVEIQKEHLEIEKQRLEMEKQRLEFERLIGTQMVAMLPMIGGLLQKVSSSNSGNTKGKRGRKRQNNENLDIFHDTKILRTMLEQGIKKYMMTEDSDNDKDSDNEDSGSHKEDSNTSNK